jgi:hypothetical protein
MMGRNKLGRLEMEEQGDLLTIVIPAVQDSNRILVIIALLGLWFLFEMYLSGTFIGGRNRFLLAFLLLWTMGGGLLSLALLWKLGGREIIVIGPDTLRIEWKIYDIGFSREYPAGEVKGLRRSNPANRSPWIRLVDTIGYSGMAYHFNYRHKIVRFGVSLRSAEIAFIHEKFKELGFVRMEI